MTDYLPDIFEQFHNEYPTVAEELETLAASVRDAGTLDDEAYRLVKLGIAIGAVAEGAVRSNARKGLEAGIEPEVMRQVALMAITTRGFPAAIAAYGWIGEVLAAEG
ncbi:MAG: hypothetical protein R3320_02125 [Nitriliruptorales bacterium]|nr:hypothetical protein [Nitriliruptorales bacterium]